MEARSMLLIYPGQVHCCLHAAEISGWVTSFDGKFLDPKARAVVEQPVGKIPHFQLTAAEFSFFHQCLNLTHATTVAENPGLFQLQLLQALINGVYYKVANLYNSQYSLPSYAARPVEITQQFIKLIKIHFLRLRKPADYAALMHLSVSYLNDTVKSMTGFRATYFIQQESMGEAQRQLLYTSLSVKEIAYLLGYQDAKYFIRLFAKVTATSPTAFRKAHQRNPANFRKTVLIFKTDVTTSAEATLILKALLKLLPNHQANFDLEDQDRILRIEGLPISPEIIINALGQQDHIAEEILF
ncbi:helix-turn-helix domain-containing protein [Adhaeribacter pallidiroseus]|nr:AraC family transcriptional regulator [Adhaeribacter pallidiroseus]